ncbi:MAG: DUF177 domain-containing protein, partial [Clostridiales bacterium]|nr:DUF177 domain-containing protein [Candidatus Crickella merdequi]
MIIDLYNLITHTGEVKKITVPIEMDSFDSSVGNYPLKNKSDLVLEIRNVGNRNLELSSIVDVTVAFPCDRCLTEVDRKLFIESHRDINFGEENPDADEFLSDMSFIDGTTFDTERYAYCEILENLPMKVLCKEDCKGICNVCGHNLNEGECDCNREVLD